MDLNAHLVARRQHGLITAQQAREAGLTPADVARLVRQGVWHRLRKAVYVDATRWADADPFTEQPLLRIHAVALTGRTDAAFSHDSAGILHGLGCPDPRTALVHRTRPRVLGSRVWAGVEEHGTVFTADQVVEVRGLRVLDRARTVVDIAREHGLGPGVAAADRALRRGTTRAQLMAAAEPMRGWPHDLVVQEAIRLADPRSDSWLEALGRVFVVKDLGRVDVEPQFGLCADGRLVWCDLRVGRHLIEIDGKEKYFLLDDARTPERRLWDEKLRQDFVTGFKLGMSRLTAADLLGPGRTEAGRRVAREIEDTERRFGTDLSDLAPYIRRRDAS